MIFLWIFLRACARILSVLFIIAGVSLVGVGIAAWVVSWSATASFDLSTPAGKLWYQLDSGSLNLTQAITERYLSPDVWDGVILPLLLLPFVESALYLIAGFLVLAAVLHALAKR